MPQPDPPNPPTQTPRPRLAFDWTEWLPHLAGIDATEAEKRELIETLWSIVLAFVDLGWEVGTIDPKDNTETGGKGTDPATLIAASMVQSGKQPAQEDV